MIKCKYIAMPGEKIDLHKLDTSEKGPFKDKDEAAEPTAKNLKRLSQMQSILYAQQKRAMLIVFQGLDAAGKDGAIDHVFSGVNPQGCSVTSFKVPTELELRHDYLWRIHAATPARGMIGIFNRSHYESVLVERVHKLVPAEVWRRRYAQINQFEKLLSDEGTVILKFFLHISRKEQKERLEARLEDASKNWKFELGDLHERRLWKLYISAYADAVEKCSTVCAPWIVVPSDHKWYRNWVVSDVIVRTLEKLDLKYPKPIKGIDKIRIK